MSNLNESQFEGFFHGTTHGFEPGDVVSPRGAARFFRADHDGAHAFATKSPDDAWDYAEKAWNHADSGHPRVFKVSPVDDYEVDPHEQNYEKRWVRSQTGFRVDEEVPMPEHMGSPEEWR